MPGSSESVIGYVRRVCGDGLANIVVECQRDGHDWYLMLRGKVGRRKVSKHVPRVTLCWWTNDSILTPHAAVGMSNALALSTSYRRACLI